MTRAELSGAKSDTAASLPSSPAERQALRLSEAIKAKKAEIKKVLRRHADSIKTMEMKVREASDARSGVEARLEVENSLILICSREIQEAKETLSRLCEDLIRLQESHSSRTSELAEKKAAEAAAKAESNATLDEPNRHVAALQKDLEKLERRYALSLARRPLTALFSGATVAVGANGIEGEGGEEIDGKKASS